MQATLDRPGPQQGAAVPLIERVRGILDVVGRDAAVSEAAGRLTDETIAALRSCNLFGLLVPKALGGWDLGAREALRIWELVSEADGGAGWVLMATCTGSGAVGALLPDVAAQKVFEGRVPIIGGQGAPRGKGRRDGDGYRVSGKWGYGSGALHADYVLSSAMFIDEDGAAPHARGFIVPASEVRFEGNWDVIGLRSTGSVDYSLKDVFVPAEYTFTLTSFSPLRGNGLFRASVEGATPFGHSAFAMGVGRRILTEIAALANAADGRTSGLADGAGEIFQEGYGTVEGKLRAGRALVFEVAEEVDDTIARGDVVSTRQISLVRLALNNVTLAAHDAARFAYRAAGGVALRDGVLQRNIRDMLAATQHRIVSSFMLRESARDLLGMAPGKVWNGGRLVDPPRAEGSS